MLQRLGGSSTKRQGSEVPDTMSVESCPSSMACDLEEVSHEAPKEMDMEEMTSEASSTAVTGGNGKEG